MVVDAKQKILVIEGETAFRAELEALLRQKGYEVIAAGGGREGLDTAARQSPDLVVLDATLPDMDGHDVCRELRREAAELPIVMLTAKTDTFDRVLPLELGADDCVCKPVNFRELVARIRVRLQRPPAAAPAGRRFRFQDVEIDFESYAATRGGEPLDLTPKEFDILRLLIHCHGKVLTRDRLLDEVWGYESYPSTRTVDAHIVKLRKKIESDPSNPRHILSVYGIGYKFVG